MGTELKLISPIPPSVNHYLAYRAIMRNSKPMAMSYVTNEAKKYKKEFAEYVKEEVWRQEYDLQPNKTQHFYVDCIFYFDRTDRDCNNYFKCMLDAITDTGLIWEDDNVVCERVSAIYYDSENPRVEIYIHPVDYIGVFDDASQLAEFEANCIGCTRYKRNCSILRNAKNGKIQAELDEHKCLKFKQINNIVKGDRL